jgi:hypothetical protein
MCTHTHGEGGGRGGGAEFNLQYRKKQTEKLLVQAGCDGPVSPIPARGRWHQEFEASLG